MTKTLLEELVSTERGMRRFQQERAISAVSGLIRQVMDDQKLKRSDLAGKLGKTKGWVTQLLDGEGNKTIRTVADVLAVLGVEMQITARPIQIGPSKPRDLKIAAGTWAKAEGRTWSAPMPYPQVQKVV